MPLKSGEFYKVLEYKYLSKITFFIVKKEDIGYQVSVLSNEAFTLSHTERNLKGGIVAHVSHHYKKKSVKRISLFF